MSKQTKIALVDDERLFLEGLALLLSNNKQLSIVFNTNDGKACLESLASMSEDNFPEVILMDIQMKPMDGFELVKRIKTEYPDLHIIILSSHYKSAIFGHMIKLGISAFLPKNAKLDLLVEAIDTVHRTGVFFTKKDHEMLAAFIKNKSSKRYFDSSERLSEREVDVLKLICSEHTNQTIAEELFISKRTVEGHRQRIMDKIGTKNTAGLVIYAIVNEIFIPDSKYYF
jgi:DNA-binding NarL/FixJ family response regulator